MGGICIKEKGKGGGGWNSRSRTQYRNRFAGSLRASLHGWPFVTAWQAPSVPYHYFSRVHKLPIYTPHSTDKQSEDLTSGAAPPASPAPIVLFAGTPVPRPQVLASLVLSRHGMCSGQSTSQESVRQHGDSRIRQRLPRPSSLTNPHAARLSSSTTAQQCSLQCGERNRGRPPAICACCTASAHR